ncbi:MAG: DUF6265 family protein [Betaproteobacteria bacterium]
MKTSLRSAAAASFATTMLATMMSIAAPALGQPAPAAPRVDALASDVTSIASLAWLEGCWAGTVNQRDFREQWGPLRGGMLLGTGSTVYQGKTQSYEFLRLDGRPDGVFYVALPSGQQETAFKLTSITTDDKDTIFTFSHPANEFPQTIAYRRATEGWLYATIEGKIKGEDKQVIYPLRRVGCESGQFILK